MHQYIHVLYAAVAMYIKLPLHTYCVHTAVDGRVRSGTGIDLASVEYRCCTYYVANAGGEIISELRREWK